MPAAQRPLLGWRGEAVYTPGWADSEAAGSSLVRAGSPQDELGQGLCVYECRLCVGFACVCVLRNVLRSVHTRV
jgi:hypothetical protein